MEDVNNCYKCGKSGHWARDCYTKMYGKPPPKKIVRCYICGKLGHLAKNCYANTRPERTETKEQAGQDPNSRSFNSIEINPYDGGDIDGIAIGQAFDSLDEHEWDFIRNESNKRESPSVEDTRTNRKHEKETCGDENQKNNQDLQKHSNYYKIVSLNGKDFVGFLDTSSEKCLMKYSAAKKSQLPVQLDDTNIAEKSPTATHDTIISIGKASTVIAIDGAKVSDVEIFVVDDKFLKVDILIGRSFLDNPRVLFMKLYNHVYLEDVDKHPFDKFCSILHDLNDTPSGGNHSKVSPYDPLSSDGENGKFSRELGESPTSHEMKKRVKCEKRKERESKRSASKNKDRNEATKRYRERSVETSERRYIDYQRMGRH